MQRNETMLDPLVITKTGLLGAEIAKQYKYKAFGETKGEAGSGRKLEFRVGGLENNLE